MATADNSDTPREYKALSVQGIKSSVAGRSLHAARYLAPGELIATFTSPVLALPDGPSSRTVCNHCLSHDTKARACTGCRAIVYCSAECQQANWSLVHKLECKAFRRVRASVNKDWLPTPVRALVQILLRWKETAVRAAFERLQGNVESFKEMEKVWQDLELQAHGGVTYAGLKGTAAELEMAMELLCKASGLPLIQ